MGLMDRFGKGQLKKNLAEIRRHIAVKKSDISDHLETIFTECLDIEAKLIVELGVGDGESTFVFERVARLWGAVLVSVDIEDCRNVSSYRDRTFVQMDDIAFASSFDEWCRKRGIEPQIDILFIDTSHLYDHTVAEIRSWFPFLADRAKVLFHDTNMHDVFVRKDGSTGRGWDNERGVIRAIEEYFNVSFEEEKDFVTIEDGWVIKHTSICNGFMVMDRYGR
jgi:cephalosporin hydroxylase